MLREEMAGYLTETGFSCETAADLLEGHNKLATAAYDAVVLDITLPDGTGMDLLRQLKSRNLSTSVLILSAKDSLSDKLAGLGLGADDYLTKPFYLEELNARLNAIIRRKSVPVATAIQVDGLEIQPEAMTVTYRQTPILLTKKEFQLLLFFIDNMNRVLSKQAILEHLWGEAYDGSDNLDTIYVHTMNLRKKLSAHTGKDHIRTMYGTGYKWERS